MIEDKYTNIIYLSKWLKYDHKEFYNRLTALLNSLDIRFEVLKYTNDYWCRDYMPIQLDQDRFLKYRYRPQYLLNKIEDKDSITNCYRACNCLGIEYKTTEIVIDGGNIVPCGEAIIMTDKVFKENGVEKYDKDLIEQLESFFGYKIIFIPWEQHGDDVYGHADGFVKYAGGDKILLSNIKDEYFDEGAEIERILAKHGYSVTSLHFEKNRMNNWAYINFLQVSDKIIMPAFGKKEDDTAMKQIQAAFPYCSVYPIEMSEIAKEGGALHCITWNIKK